MSTLECMLIWCVVSYHDMPVIRSVTEELSGKEKLVLQEECELVTVMEVVKGQLEVTTTHMHFFDHTPSRESGDTQDFKWQLAELREIHFRRYNLRRSALEFFFVDQSNCFINFQKEVQKCPCWYLFTLPAIATSVGHMCVQNFTMEVGYNPTKCLHNNRQSLHDAYTMQVYCFINI